MKKISLLLKRNLIVFSIVAVCVLLLAGVLGWSYVQHYREASAHAASEYSSYRELMKRHENAAYIPGADENPIRQELNTTLARILTDKMSDAERIALAKKGNLLLKESEKQIDAMGADNDAVNASIARIESGAQISFGFSTGGNNMTEVVTLAKKEMDVIADIRGLSYKANFETKKIFDRIITDKGKLTAAHMTALNDQIPEVEKQFNARTNLYTELQDTSALLDQKFSHMGGIYSVVGK